jgi:hypothetical protein
MKIVPLFLELSILLSACTPLATPVVALTSSPAPTQTAIQIAMQTSTPTGLPSGFIFPSITADAGNFSLQAGETITITWQGAPAGADKYEFVLVPQNKESPFVLGIDLDESDGVAVSWTVPEHFAADLHATAYFSDGREIQAHETFAPALYSGDFPPAGVCSLRARHQPVAVYRLPDRTSEVFAKLSPGVYARVLEIASDGWYHVDASTAELYIPFNGNLPDTDFHAVSLSGAMNSDRSPASGDGWINSDNGVLLAGTCP